MQFQQPDTITPDLYNPQALNRYAYVLGNPIQYKDPSGHRFTDSMDDIERDGVWADYTRRLARRNALSGAKYILELAGVELSGNWSEENTIAVSQAIQDVGERFSKTRGRDETPSEAFKSVYRTDQEEIVFTWLTGSGVCDAGPYDMGGCTKSDHNIEFISMAPDNPIMDNKIRNAVHELGHLFNNRMESFGINYLPNSLGGVYALDRAQVLKPFYWDETGIIEYKFSNALTGPETFADMFVAYTYGVWNPIASAIRDNAINDMNWWMATWIR